MTLNIKLLAAGIAIALSNQVTASQFVQIDPVSLEQLKTELSQSKASEEISKKYQELLTQADKDLSMKNPTVMDKTFIPPSKDKHDYLSLSRYWWPDPSKEDGLPWIRKDGETNPKTQTDDVDRPRISVMGNTVYGLALAYYLSGNDKYAEKSASMIKTWFLDPETKMNPNLNYAQSVPGYSEGRRAGILDGRFVQTMVLDAVKMLEKSKSWSSDDDKKMDEWLAAHLDWLTKSEIGIDGATQENNHGTWYRFQVSSIAYYLGDKTIALESINATKDSMNSQFAEDGSQPEELARTRAFFYSCFNLDALGRVAIVADKLGAPIWQYQPSKGKGIKAGFDFLKPVIHGAEWDYPNQALKFEDCIPALVKYNQFNPNNNYVEELQIATKFQGKDVQKVYNQMFILENNEM